jgi:hypothetical protein
MVALPVDPVPERHLQLRPRCRSGCRLRRHLRLRADRLVSVSLFFRSFRLFRRLFRLADSDLLAATTYPHEIGIPCSYEANPNLLTAIENKVGTTTVSRYEYTRVRRTLEAPAPEAGRGRSGPRSSSDAINRSTARVHSSTAFTVADTADI